MDHFLSDAWERKRYPSQVCRARQESSKEVEIDIEACICGIAFLQILYTLQAVDV